MDRGNVTVTSTKKDIVVSHAVFCSNDLSSSPNRRVATDSQNGGHPFGVDRWDRDRVKAAIKDIFIHRATFRVTRQCNDPCSIADKLPNGDHSVLAVIVVAVMPDDYHMAVVAAVVAVMPIWLRKSAGGKEHKQDKY
jgi:hypothetical protein